jgi:hypothetical protein
MDLIFLVVVLIVGPPGGGRTDQTGVLNSVTASSASAGRHFEPIDTVEDDLDSDAVRSLMTDVVPLAQVDQALLEIILG